MILPYPGLSCRIQKFILFAARACALAVLEVNRLKCDIQILYLKSKPQMIPSPNVLTAVALLIIRRF